MVDGNHGKGGEVCTAVPTAIAQRHGRRSSEIGIQRAILQLYRRICRRTARILHIFLLVIIYRWPLHEEAEHPVKDGGK